MEPCANCGGVEFGLLAMEDAKEGLVSSFLVACSGCGLTFVMDFLVTAHPPGE